MRKSKKVISMMLALSMVFSLSACGSKNDEATSTSAEPANSAEASATEETTSTGAKTVADGITTIDQIELGTDYEDVTATIKVLTHRTDLVDTSLVEYVKQFNEMYPNITVEYEGITNYADDITTRLTASDWGDICMIPTSVDKSELSTYFVPFGDLTTLSEKYIMLNDKSSEGTVYGIPTVGNAQGVVYNKKVFADAGITEIPKTPDEFLDALQKIKDNTEAIPLYTNFSAQWTMGAWDAYLGGSSNGDPDYMNNLPHLSNPFSDNGQNYGPYNVYKVLYESVARGLVEDDPTTSDWEGCKGMINNGEIGTMVLGSWAVVQMQQAGDNADDIGYMPFPISVDGKQYATAGPDYCYGINANSPVENQIASMVFTKWMTEIGTFAFDEGGIPIVQGAEYPAVLDAFNGVELVINNPAPAGEEDLFTTINNDSEVGLNTDNIPDCEIVEHALSKDMTLDEIMDEWNAKWSQAQEDNDVEIYE